VEILGGQKYKPGLDCGTHKHEYREYWSSLLSENL